MAESSISLGAANTGGTCCSLNESLPKYAPAPEPTPPPLCVWAAGLPPPLTLGGDAACGPVMSNVASVITTTTNTVVDSANSAVSIGRWSNLAIIAFSSFLSVWEDGSHCYASVACGCAYQLWGNTFLLLPLPLELSSSAL